LFVSLRSFVNDGVEVIRENNNNLIIFDHFLELGDFRKPTDVFWDAGLLVYLLGQDGLALASLTFGAILLRGILETIKDTLAKLKTTARLRRPPL